MFARFDDLRTGSALVCPEPDRVIEARTTEEVRPALEAVDRATVDGWWAYGYVAYEAAAGLDPCLAVHAATPYDMPLVWFGICTEPTSVPVLTPATEPSEPRPAWERGWTPQQHARRVETVRARIAAGDTYQTNLTERVHGCLDGASSEALYRDLALAQRGAYNAYLDLGPWVVASASPELFFERRGDDVLLRPMKGTARRGRFSAEDAAFAEHLRSSPKERAENIMIVDLLRNDVGRVAMPGTVAVPRMLQVESYETVLQLTSDVTARLRPGVGLAELFTALFPCGSVTGAPKPSTMHIIRELEPEPRGVYCGAIGLVGPTGARFNVAIRTAVSDMAAGTAVYGTGGGITWDSDPETEQAEMVAKTAILFAHPSEFALFETMRHDPATGLRNRSRHLARLADSAAHLGFFFDRAEIDRALDIALSGRVMARVRLRLERDGQIRVDVEPMPPVLDRPVRLAFDDDPVDPTDWRWFHKTTRREPYEQHRSLRPDVDDVIMINTAGEVTETTTANLAVDIDGRWWTPALSAGCLPGVERARLIDLGELHEANLTPDDVRRATRIAVVNSLRGWRSAELVA